MTDYRSLEELLVYRDSALVGRLRRLPKGCEFKYTDEFLRSNEAPIALRLPKDPAGLRVEGVANLPTYFAGLLPEGVMFAAVKNLIGAAADDLFSVLAATGSDAIGDIDVRPPGEEKRATALNLDEASELIKSLLDRKRVTSTEQLSAIPGVQPKLSIGQVVRSGRKTTYIAKFESPDLPGLVLNEFSFMHLAKRCRIEAAKVKIRDGVLIVQRFDREFDKGTESLLKVHVEDMVQVMDLFPNSKYSVEYADLMEAMQKLGVSKASLLDALRLYVFSYIIANGDLHAKNVSLLRDRGTGQWRLTPAYDLLSTLPYKNVLAAADRMALALEDEAFGKFTMADFATFGKRFGLPERSVKQMVDRTARAVLKNLRGQIGEFLAPEDIQLIEERAESLTGEDV